MFIFKFILNLNQFDKSSPYLKKIYTVASKWNTLDSYQIELL